MEVVGSVSESSSSSGESLVLPGRYLDTDVMLKLSADASSIRREFGVLEKLNLKAGNAFVRPFRVLDGSRGDMVSRHGDDLTGYHGMAMEKGQRSLAVELFEHRPSAMHELLSIVDNLVDILCELYRAGIVHSDFKPQNIVKVPDISAAKYHWKAIDFDNCKSFEKMDRVDSKCTPLYISPEVARWLQGGVVAEGAPRASPATDVFALGLMVFEMASAVVLRTDRGVSLWDCLGVDKTDEPQVVSRAARLSDGDVMEAISGRFEGNQYAPLRSFLADALRVEAKDRKTAQQLKSTRSFLQYAQPTVDYRSLARREDVAQIGEQINSLSLKLDGQFEGVQSQLEKLCDGVWDARSLEELGAHFGDVKAKLQAEAAAASEGGSPSVEAVSQLLRVFVEDMRQSIAADIDKAGQSNRALLQAFQEEITGSVQQAIASVADSRADGAELTRSVEALAAKMGDMQGSIECMRGDLLALIAKVGSCGEMVASVVAGNEQLLMSVGLLESAVDRVAEDQKEEFARHSKELLDIKTALSIIPDSLREAVMVGLQPRLDAANNALDTLLVGAFDLPTLAIVLPVPVASWTTYLKRPVSLVKDEYMLYFLCSHTYRIAPCGPQGRGFSIRYTKEWVRRAAPVLKVGLVALKLALAAGGIPLPISGICDALSDLGMHSKIVDIALQTLQSSAATDAVEGAVGSMLDQSLGALDSAASAPSQQQIQESLAEVQAALAQADKRAAYQAIKSALAGQDLEKLSGLVRLQHKGKVSWILRDQTQSFLDNDGQPAPARPVADIQREAAAQLAAQQAADAAAPSRLAKAGGAVARGGRAFVGMMTGKGSRP